MLDCRDLFERKATAILDADFALRTGRYETTEKQDEMVSVKRLEGVYVGRRAE
jgi:hypothetical protein